MSKHTPGPWFVEEQPYVSSSYYIRGSDKNGKRLAWSKGAVAHIPRSTVMPMEANASLIASSPALLEAPRCIVANAVIQPDARMEGATDCYAVPIDDIQAALEAIHKATGE